MTTGAETSLPVLTVRSLRVTPILVPMNYALGTSAARVTEAPLLLVDLETEEGVTGRTYLFCYRLSGARAIALLLEDAVSLVRGEQLRPQQIAAKLARNFTLIGVTGTVRMALSGLDAAMWDALAVAARLPLASLLGYSPRPIRAYNSCGLGLMGPALLADEAARLTANGFKAVKLRLGYPTLAEDVAALKAVRGRIGTEIDVMVDYNQMLTVEEALRRAYALGREGVLWLEEPIRHDDLEGNAEIAAATSIPLQLGENFNGVPAMAAALRARACGLVMPDLARIGGVTGWMDAASLAADQGIAMSSHLFPEVSAHLLAATPSADWLEYVDWADAFVQEPLKIMDGMAIVPDRPGSGLEWDVRAVERFRLT
ncbi:MAG TPA: enolase C-terminal domain-like protein [Micropepsaceae bacterium]|nr:enolase C-terminal domain-like protein [Micropepsaceae bacterium]